MAARILGESSIIFMQQTERFCCLGSGKKCWSAHLEAELICALVFSNTQKQYFFHEVANWLPTEFQSFVRHSIFSDVSAITGLQP